MGAPEGHGQVVPLLHLPQQQRAGALLPQLHAPRLAVDAGLHRTPVALGQGMVWLLSLVKADRICLDWTAACGPFFPSDVPQWTQAYTARLLHSVKVCLAAK